MGSAHLYKVATHQQPQGFVHANTARLWEINCLDNDCLEFRSTVNRWKWLEERHREKSSTADVAKAEDVHVKNSQVVHCNTVTRGDLKRFFRLTSHLTF